MTIETSPPHSHSEYVTRDYLAGSLSVIQDNAGELEKRLEASIERMGGNLLTEMEKRFDAFETKMDEKLDEFKQDLLSAINGRTTTEDHD